MLVLSFLFTTATAGDFATKISTNTESSVSLTEDSYCNSGCWKHGDEYYMDCKEAYGEKWENATSRGDCKKPQSCKDKHKDAVKVNCWRCSGEYYKDCEEGWEKATSHCDCKQNVSWGRDNHKPAVKCDEKTWKCPPLVGDVYKDCEGEFGKGWEKAMSRCDCKKPQSCKDEHRAPIQCGINSTCPDNNQLTFLFAHGLNGNPLEWEHFAKKVEEHGFNVWTTQVNKLGHIDERGEQLANYINQMNKKCGGHVKPKSVIVVGHSMGGLDVRYIVGNSQNQAGGKYKKATDLIRSVYTIATPHLGDPNACLALGGAHDLCGHPKNPNKDSPMKKFNDKYPASDFNDAEIYFTAIYYECKKKAGEDGVVPIDSQKWKGEEISRHDGGVGYHKTKDYPEKDGCVPELCQDEEIDWIMDQERVRDLTRGKEK